MHETEFMQLQAFLQLLELQQTLTINLQKKEYLVEKNKQTNKTKKKNSKYVILTFIANVSIILLLLVIIIYLLIYLVIYLYILYLR